MALARWTPMGNLQSFQDEMNRMFNQFFRGGAGEEAGWGVRTWAPPVDIYETDDALVLKAVLPTLVDQEHVQASYTDGVLELRLPKSEAAKPKRIATQS